MRKRFGSTGQSSDETTVSNGYNFTTNGSSPKAALAKSASQDNLTANKHFNSNERLSDMLLLGLTGR